MPAENPLRPPALAALVVLLAGEFLLVAALTVLLVVELLVDTPESLPSAIALLVLTALAATWLGAMVRAAVLRRAWVRGSALVWNVLQMGVGIAALQGVFASPLWGWPLLGVAIVAILLLLSPPVTDALRERGDDRAS